MPLRVIHDISRASTTLPTGLWLLCVPLPDGTLFSVPTHQLRLTIHYHGHICQILSILLLADIPLTGLLVVVPAFAQTCSGFHGHPMAPQ